MISSGVAAAEEEYWITIDPILDQMLGTTYTISGETNLPAEIELLDKETIPTATQTPGFGLGILAVAFGIAVILGTLRRK